jgi:hypothetical protein
MCVVPSSAINDDTVIEKHRSLLDLQQSVLG